MIQRDAGGGQGTVSPFIQTLVTALVAVFRVLEQLKSSGIGGGACGWELIFAEFTRVRVASDPVYEGRDEGEDVWQLGSCKPGGGLRAQLSENVPTNVESHPMLKDCTPISS